MRPIFSLSPTEYAVCRQIMQKHSITYFTATQFLPRWAREQVFVLYAWVRLADEDVDNPTAHPEEQIKKFEREFMSAWHSETAPPMQAIFVRLTKTAGFELSWCSAFLASMKLDVHKNRYANSLELQQYVFGSAEVIGLMMAKILGVHKKHHGAAQALGEWMQLVNIIRDIGEDWQQRNRLYIPADRLARYGLTEHNLTDMNLSNARAQLIRDWIQELDMRKKKALTGFVHLPRFSQLAIYAATVLYQWALDQIDRNPEKVWHKPVKPNHLVIFFSIPRIIKGFWQQKFE